MTSNWSYFEFSSQIHISERPKPLFWFRSDTETETLIGRQFRPIPKPQISDLVAGLVTGLVTGLVKV